MKKETLKALEKSICKWDKILQGIENDKYSKNCPLCMRFSDEEYDFSCVKFGKNGTWEKCPVFEYSKIDGCRDTPWDKLYDVIYNVNELERNIPILINKDNIPTLVKDNIIALVEDEFMFLVNLLPENHKIKLLLK